MPRSRELMDRVLATWAAYTEANLNFARLNAEVLDRSHGMEHPDGLIAIRKLGQARREAFEAYSRALREYTDYLMDIEGRQRQQAVSATSGQ